MLLNAMFKNQILNIIFFMATAKRAGGKSAKKRSVRQSKKQQLGTLDLFLIMILVAFIGGSVITSAKISLEVIPPFTLTFFIFLITYIITASIAVGKKSRVGSRDFNDNFFPAFFIVANLFALFFALKYTSAVMVAVILAAVPLILISYLKIFNNRRLVCDQKMGLLLGGMGLCLVVFQPFIQLCSGSGLDFALEIIKGNLLALVSALFSTFYILNRQKYTKKSVNPTSIVFYASLMAMLISVAPMLFIEFQDFDFVSKITLEHVGMVMWLNIVGVFLFNLLYQFLIRDKFIISIYHCMLSIFGVVIAIAVLGEVLPWLVIVGAVMMIVGGKMTADKIKSGSKDKKINKKTKTVSAKRKSDKLSIEKKGVEGGINKLGIFVSLIIAGVTAGSIPTATVIAKSSGLAPLAVLFFRYAIAFVIMLPIIVKREELSFEDFKNNFLPSFLAVMNPVILFSVVPEYTTASVSILIYAAGPLFMALYYVFFCKAKLTQNQLIGLGVGFVGVALILFQPITSGGVGIVVGNLMVIVSTLFFVSYTIFSGKQQAKKLVSPYSLVFYSSIVAMAISFIPMLQGVNKVELGFSQIGAIVWLGLISTVVFFILFQFIVKREGTLVASVYAYLQATLGAIIGLVVLDEKITILVIAGAILTFVGAKIVTQKVEKKKRRKPRKKAKKSAKKKTAKKSVKTAKKISEKKIESKEIEKKEVGKVEDKKVELVAKDKKSDDLNEGDVIKVRVIGGDKR